MLEKFLIWSSKAYRKPWIIISTALLITVITAFGIPKIRFDANIKSMLPTNNRSRVISDYYEDENRFGSSDMIFVGVEASNIYDEKTLVYIKDLKDSIEALNNVIPAKNMAKLLRLSDSEGAQVIEALRGVGINEGNYTETLVPLITSADALVENFAWGQPFADKVAKAASKVDSRLLYEYYNNPIDKIQSLVNADYIASEDDALVVKQLVDNEEITSENIAGLKERIASWELYEGTIVSSDATLTPIIISLKTGNNEVKASLDRAIASVIKEKANPDFKTYLDGEPVIDNMIAQQMFDDIKLLLPLVVIVVLLILYLCFRNIQGVVYPALIILLSVVSSMGIMAFCNVPITIVGITIPVLLVAIVSAYTIHQMNHYLLSPDTDKLAILNGNMKNVGLAITLSGITVMVGFGALIAEDFVPIKNFGIFTAIGDFIGVVGALYVLPAIILASKKPKTVFNTEEVKGPVSALLAKFVKLNKRHSTFALAASVVLCLISLFGAFKVVTELNNVSFFKKNNPIHVADDRLNEKLAGTMTLNVILDSDLSDPATRKDTDENAEIIEITTPEVLNEIERFEKDVQGEFPFVRKVMSFNNIARKMNREMNGGDPTYYTLPQSRELISQYLLIFSGDVSSVLTPNHDKLRISLTMKRVSSAETEIVRQYCMSYFSPEFLEANHLQVQISGTANLYNVANTLLVDGMITSIIICLIIVFILLLFVLCDFWMSIIAMTPIFMTLLINFGLMGFLKIPLNAATAIVSSIAIGIGVDYSIHFITWYRNELRTKPDIHAALENSITHKGRAILYNMFVIFGGFIVLVVSNFVPLVQFGGLVAACMVFTATGALVVVPAIIRLLARWDLKFLYLGTKPKK